MHANLTPAQRTSLLACQRKWIKSGLDTAISQDQTRIKYWLDVGYYSASEKPPQNILWARSPVEALRLASDQQQRSENNLWALGWQKKRNKDMADMAKSMLATTSRQVLDDVRIGLDPIRDKVHDQVWSAVLGAVRNPMHSPVWDVSSLVWSGVEMLPAHRMALISYFSGVLRNETTQLLEWRWQLSTLCGWWWPFEHTAVVTRKPIYVSTDGAGDLHNEHGPAMLFADGWAVYRFSGGHHSQAWWTKMYNWVKTTNDSPKSIVRSLLSQSPGAWEPLVAWMQANGKWSHAAAKYVERYGQLVGR